MTTQTLTHTSDATAVVGILPLVLAAATGLTLIFFTSFAGASVLHDAAHDARHALAFPCH